MDEKVIRITCGAEAFIPYTQLEHFQGHLKDLSDENFAKLRKEILELGFTAPVLIWKKPDGSMKVCDGHQRGRVVKRMVEVEGFTCPDIPVCFITAVDEKEAKRKVLALTSQYGNMTSQGLYEFMEEAELQFDEVSTSFRFPEIEFEKFNEEFYDQPNFAPGTEDEQGKLDEKMPITCPKCGESFVAP